MMQFLAAAGDAGSVWSTAAIAFCLIAAVSFIVLVPLAITYIALPEYSWPAAGSVVASASFIVFGVLGVSCAYVAQAAAP